MREGKLQLSVIGYYGKYPSPKHATSCYLLQGAGKRIVIDMGSGALLKLTRFIDPATIDTIILSHLHGDHIADIFAYKNIALERNISKKYAKVQLIAPQTPKIILDAILEGDFFEYHPLGEGIFNIGEIKCHAYKMTHPIETYGIKFALGSSCISYTSDTLFNENLAPLICGSNLVIADACILEREFNETSKHISVAQISKLSQGRKLILSHLFYGKEKAILAEALKYNNLAQLASEGLEITV